MNAIKPPVKAYSGSEPYIFISYSHRDSEIVYPAIEHLTASYFRIWYDDGIEPGKIWTEVLETKIREAFCLIVFISGTSVNSKHVMSELNFARTYDKQIFPIYLESKIELPNSIKDFISGFQSISISTAKSTGDWTGITNYLPIETKEYQSSLERLRYLEKGINDPLVMRLLQETVKKEIGWCSIHRRGKPYEDYVQTCKLCGYQDWFEAKGLGSPRTAQQCPNCGLLHDPGKAKPWFTIKKKEGENIYAQCSNCDDVTIYAFEDGPPLICPTCGRLE